MTGTKILHLWRFQTHSHAHSSRENTEGHFKPREKSKRLTSLSVHELAGAKPETYRLSLMDEYVIQHKALIMCGKDEFDMIGSLEIANTHREVPTVQQVYPESVPIVADTDQKKQLITGKTSTNDILVIYMLLAQRKYHHEKVSP